MYKVMQAYTMTDLCLDAGIGLQPGNFTAENIAHIGEYLSDYVAFDYQDLKYLKDITNLVFSRFGEEFIFIIPNSDTKILNYQKWFKRFVNTILMTNPKYETLLDAYDAEKENLLKAIKSTQTSSGTGNNTSNVVNSGTDENTETGSNAEASSRVESDTPQETGSIDAIQDLTYASNIEQDKRSITRSVTSRYTKGTSVAVQDTSTNSNTVTTEDERATKIARLNELENLFSNVLKKWSDEFSGLFIEDLNCTSVEDY